MRYYTHIITSLAGVTALAPYLNLHISVPLVSGVLIGSVLPDIDESRSYIGKRIPFFSRPVNLLFGHRGITHSAIACIAAGLMAFTLQHGFTTGLFLGYLFHVAGDLFSKAGVPLFAPLTNKRTTIPIYRTGKFSELLILAVAAFYLYKEWF